MTVNFVISQTMKLRPDTIPDSVKCRWLGELDGKIARETMHKNNFTPYEFPRDGETELLVQAPYDNLYELYIMAMSDFFSGEMASYAQSAAMFEQAYTEFRKNYIRNNMPPQNKITF